MAGNVEFIAWIAEWELYPLSYGTFWKNMGPLTGGQRATGGGKGTSIGQIQNINDDLFALKTENTCTTKWSGKQVEIYHKIRS